MAKHRNNSKKRLSEEEEHEITEMMVNAQKKKQESIFNKYLSDTGIEVKFENVKQKSLYLAIKEKEVIFCSGPAGTGKTFMACAAALKLLKSSNMIYSRIILIKSVTPLKGEEIGFLKGDLDEKMRPFMFSFTSQFYKLLGRDITESLKANHVIEWWPIAYLRGSNIDDSIVIIDEIQNITIDNMKTILTRLGKNSKLIFLGDSEQIDLRNKHESSLEFIIKNFKDLPELGMITFTEEDIVRNQLIKKLVAKFKELGK